MKHLDLTQENKLDLILLLRKSPKGVRVTFTKANGETREMQSTLNPDIISEISGEPVPETETVGFAAEEDKWINQSSLRVFDMDVTEWRSFRWDRLQYASVELDYSTVVEMVATAMDCRIIIGDGDIAFVVDNETDGGKKKIPYAQFDEIVCATLAVAKNKTLETE